MIRVVKPNLPANANDGQIRAALAQLNINFKRRGRGPAKVFPPGHPRAGLPNGQFEDLDTTSENIAVIRARANATPGQTPTLRRLRLDTLRFHVDDNGDIMSYQYGRD